MTVVEALKKVADLDAESYLEAPDCSVVLAAAELVAAMAGRPHANLPDDALEWTKSRHHFSTLEVRDIAARAIDRVASSSELLELWSESPDLPKWQESVSDLKNRVSNR